MSRILVTGGAGYIGSHTVKELVKAGYKNIIVVDDLSNGDKERVPENVTLIKGDFADIDLLEKYFKEGIETVIHFAAYKIAPESVVSPEKYYENNVAKSIRLLDICTKYKVNNFIFSSSAAVYGDVQGFPITEDLKTEPTNPYGWTKLMFEQVLKDVSKARNIKHVSLRYFNAGGADPEGLLGNDHSSGEDVISILMTMAKSNKPFTIFGTGYDTKDGTCIRDLIHVTDLARAHIDAIKYLEKGGDSLTVNLGSEEGFSVREIANLTKEITGKPFDIADGPRRDGDIVVSIASSKRAKDILGWERQYSDIKTLIETAWNWENK